MSAHRLAISNLLRNGPRFTTLPQHPVQTTSTDQYNDEETNNNRIHLANSVVPYINLLGTDIHNNPFSLPIGHLRNPSVDVGSETVIHKLLSSAASHSTLSFFPKQQKKTAEASVQTDLRGVESEISFGQRKVDTRTQEEQKKWRQWNDIGEQLMSLEQDAEAVQYFRVAAENGDVTAMFNLGACLYDGECVDQNYFEAYGWFQRAADLGNKDAMYHLGCCLNKGTGTKINSQKGLEWINKSAHAGNIDAAFFMITHHVYERKPNLARVFIAPTASDPDYDQEMRSWVTDRCVSEECIAILREELRM